MRQRASAPAQGGRRLGWWLFAAGVALYLLLSAQGLLALGIPYDAPRGPFIVKLHPGSWLIACACLVLLASHGHPMRVAGSQFAAQPLLAVYLACIAFTFVYSIARHGPSGAAFIIDTLVMPAVCALTLLMLEARRRHACLVLVVVLLAANTLLGLGESLLQVRLVPLRLAGGDEVAEEFFRPSALLGHPLANALVTATLLPAALYLRAAMAWRCLLMLLFWVGVLAFGGRTSFILASVLFGGYFALVVASAALRGRFSYVQFIGGALLAVLTAALLAAAIAASGIGERIFRSLVWDASASVRTRIWDVFRYLSYEDIWVGVSPADMLELLWRLGLNSAGEAIENFWLVMFLQLGAIGFVPFALAMGCAVAWLWRSSRGAMRVSVLLFLVSASSNNSLASKTVAFSMLFIAVAATRKTHVPPALRVDVPDPAMRDGGRRPLARPQPTRTYAS